MESKLISGMYLLQKFPGKGGWVFAEIPEIKPNNRNPFGWVVVSGSIDNYELKHHKLMPLGNGNLFLPVKSSIRKIIGKEYGDIVLIKIHPDNSQIFLPNDVLECFKTEPPVLFEKFKALTKNEQNRWMHWINNSTGDLVRVNRIVTMFKCIQNNTLFSNK